MKTGYCYNSLCYLCIAGSGRGFCLGRLWRQDGVLAVSVAQEGVIRSAKLWWQILDQSIQYSGLYLCYLCILFRLCNLIGQICDVWFVYMSPRYVWLIAMLRSMFLYRITYLLIILLGVKICFGRAGDNQLLLGNFCDFCHIHVVTLLYVIMQCSKDWKVTW